jgi:hypothetical protein
LKHALVALVVVASTACSIWAALDDPYKGEAATATSDAGTGPTEAGPDVVNHVLDAGFVPYAIGSYGDTVYAVDDHANVHVAYEGGTTFSPFSSGGAGDLFDPSTNGIAANASGVFWTVSAGVRYCASDGGACGLFSTLQPPGKIAASDIAVAWIDPMGARECSTPLSSCINPLIFPAGTMAKNVAVAPDGTVAWAVGTYDIRFGGMGVVSLPAQVYFVAIDATTGELYWVGPAALGVVSFDGGVGPTSPLTSPTPSTALFADRGVVFWSVNGYGIESCAFELDAGCVTVRDVLTGVPTLHGNPQAREIVATSRNVFALVTSDATLPPYPLLVALPRSGR